MIVMLVGIVVAAIVGYLVGRAHAPSDWMIDSDGALINLSHVRWIGVNDAVVAGGWNIPSPLDPFAPQPQQPTNAFVLMKCRNEVDARRQYERLGRRLHAYKAYKGS